jgi:DNA-binding MarR family transcriptional regulator
VHAGSGTHDAARATTENIGFLLAKASTRWNELLAQAFSDRGYADVRPAYGSVLLPLFEEDGRRMGELTALARQPKQTTTTLVRQMERDGLVRRLRDVDDSRVWRIHLTERALAFKPVAEEVLEDLDCLLAEHLSMRTAEAVKDGLRSVMEL